MAISFAADIRPLFRPTDIACMLGHNVKLDNYDYMSGSAGDAKFPDHANARRVYCYLQPNACKPRMPFHGPYWTVQQLDLFNQWMADGFQP
jgi:hypothetical protein